jgi:hypothetical protein
VREEHFTVTLGESAALQPSEHFIRFFCAAGGTHLFGRDDLPAAPKVGSKVGGSHSPDPSTDGV